MRRKAKVELLAPAGDINAFYGALNAGADAVYLAGSRFGARAYAENFSEDKIIECIQYCHLFDKKIYLTVNTLMKEEEIPALYDFIKPLYIAGLDAVIVQDIGVLRYLGKNFPDLELHASTQMSICTEYGVSILQEMGVSRIVPARELSLKEIEEIHKKCDVEIETFIHGAMCYCYSGQCLFSSILGGRSGNRGRCAQPCRLPYKVKHNKKDNYYLSMKDMCTIEHIPLLIQSGITSFKIEGRMKKPEYAAGVTAIYRKYIDVYYDLERKYGSEEAIRRFYVQKDDLEKLNSLYIRSETQDGYYFRHNGKEMITLSSPAYHSSDERLLESIRRDYLSNKLKKPVDIYVSFQENQPVSLIMNCEDVSVTVYGNMVQRAQKQPITEENIRKQIAKFGDSPFYVNDIFITMDENVFYPLKEINELRRNAIKELTGHITQSRTVNCSNNSTDSTKHCKEFKGNPNWSISLSNTEQIQELSDFYRECKSPVFPENIYVPGDLALDNLDLIKDLKKYLTDSSVFLTLPYVFRSSDTTSLADLTRIVQKSELFCGFLVRNIDELGYLINNKFDCELHADVNLYVWNSEALTKMTEWFERVCIPYELNGSEQKQLTRYDAHFSKICYGRIPMMITANCIQRTLGHCDKSNNQVTILEDRYGKVFPVKRDCRHCLNIIYNSVPLFLKPEADKTKANIDYRLDFTIENRKEMKLILDSFMYNSDYKPSEYTTGHEKRGVE